MYTTKENLNLLLIALAVYAAVCALAFIFGKEPDDMETWMRNYPNF